MSRLFADAIKIANFQIAIEPQLGKNVRVSKRHIANNYGSTILALSEYYKNVVSKKQGLSEENQINELRLYLKSDKIKEDKQTFERAFG